MIVKEKLLPVILAVLMVFTMMPASAGIVYGANGDPAMTLGPYMLDQNVNTSTAQTVWYANEAWRVIGYDGYGAASENDTVTLLSARNLDLSKFGEKYPLSNVYADSTLKVKVDAIAGGFAEGEQSAIVKRTLVHGKYNGDNTDCIAGDGDIPDVLLWPLSAKEANDVNSDLRILDPAHPAWATSYSWLRSPGERDYWAGYINGSGGVDYSGESVGSSYGVRTAFYLDPGSVLFTSAAENGKVSGTEGANALEKQSDLTNSGDEWKVTLRSGHKDFKISECIATINYLKFKYTGATVGTEDKPEYISAVITDKPVTDTSAAIKYYGRIQTCTSESGTVRINTAGKLGDNEYLYIFNEQYNGDKSTDYASALQEFRPPEPISYDVTFKVVNGSWNDGTKKDKTVTLNGHEGDTLKLASEQIPEAGEKPNENCKAGKWDTAPSTDTAITENTTYTYTYIDSEVESVIAMIEALPEIDAMKRTDAAAVQEAKDAYDALTEVQQAQIDTAVTTKLNKAVDRAGKIVAEAAEAADLRDKAVVDLAQLDKLVDESLYTAASYQNYADAYQAFNELVDADEATTEQLRTARSAVIKAYTDLKKRADEPRIDPAMNLGTDILDQNVNTSTAKKVWYANEAWRVIGYDGCGAASESDAATLLSAGNLDMTKFAENSPLSNFYADSTLKEKVDAIAGRFAEGEQSSIVKRTLVHGKYNGDNTDCIAGNADIPDVLLWPLSAKEANEVNSDIRLLDPAHKDWATSYSWLRSPGELDYWAGLINGSGVVDYNGDYAAFAYGVRTAFYLDLGSVLFTSSAEGGKISGTEGANALEKQSDLTNSGDAWKVTLRSGHEDFRISECVATVNGVKFKYTGAAAGTEDKPEYISAVITDKPVTDTSATIKYYGRIQTCTSESGSVRINTAGKLGDNEYLYIFNEQYNGDKSTDYASALQEFRISGPISYNVTFKVVNGSWNDGTKEDKTVTLNGHEGDTLKLASEQIPEAGDKPDENCKEGSWDTTPGADTAITENTTYTYTYTDSEVESVIAMIEALPEIDAMKRTDAAAVQEAKDAYDALTQAQQAEIDATVVTSLNKAVDRAGKIVAEAAEAADLRDRAVVDLAQLDKLVDGSLYRAASYRNYVDAYEAFNKLVDDNEATTEQLRTARSAVIKAYKNLEKKIDISDSEITGLEAVSYTGKAQTQKPVVTLDGTTLNPDTEYKVSYKNNIKAGTATVIVTGIGDDHTGTATAAFKINKAANPLKVSVKTATVKYNKLKKKAQSLAVTKVIKFTKKLDDKKNYTLSSAKKGSKSFKKYFKISKTTGKVTIKKNSKMKKGTYKVKVKVKALGNSNYKASGLKSVTFTVKVR